MTIAIDRPAKLTQSQEAVLQKYLIGDEKTWEDVCDRVATFVAGAEESPGEQAYWRSQFLSILEPMKFMPGGSILANCAHGTESLLNCFVLSAEDDLESMMTAVKDAVMTTKFRGGVGLNIGSEGQTGYIRPKGSPFKDGTAFGPCAFLDMISHDAAKITTGNRARRGAFLWSMDWRHPDIWEFIGAKKQSSIDANLAKGILQQTAELVTSDESEGKKKASLDVLMARFQEAWGETHLSPEGKRERRWHNANISVQVDDEFFARLALRDGPVTALWEAIATNAHRTADPGLLLTSNAKRTLPIRDFALTTNPCGELMLPANSACNLGSIVTPYFITRHEESGKVVVDWQDLIETVKIATRFLDNVLTVSKFATEAQKENVQNRFRQIGLGVLGWADCLKMYEIAYDSDEHLELIDAWGAIISMTAYRTSEELAVERGACGVWDEIKDVQTGNPFERWTDGKQAPRRNSTIIAVAPTGSIAQLAGASWAFEPDFGLTTYKQVFVDASKGEQDWVSIPNPYLDQLDLSDADIEIVLETGSLIGTQFAKDNPKRAEGYKIAREITPEWHIRVQAQWQSWIDESVSKTINLPADATVEDIKDLYLMANKMGLKGVTVYRSGTLDSEPIKVGNQEKEGVTLDLTDGNEVENKTLVNGCKDNSCSL